MRKEERQNGARACRERQAREEKENWSRVEGIHEIESESPQCALRTTLVTGRPTCERDER